MNTNQFYTKYHNYFNTNILSAVFTVTAFYNIMQECNCSWYFLKVYGGLPENWWGLSWFSGSTKQSLIGLLLV